MLTNGGGGGGGGPLRYWLLCSITHRSIPGRWLRLYRQTLPGCASFSSDHHQPEGSSARCRAGDSRNRASSVDCAADRSERPAAARRKLRPENFARKLLPRAFGPVAGKQNAPHVGTVVRFLRGEFLLFSRGVRAHERAGYWTVSVRIWLGLELDFVRTNWKTMN